MFLLWIVENIILSFLESKILLWKVNFHIYFPQWQVMSKVSVEPCGEIEDLRLAYERICDINKALEDSANGVKDAMLDADTSFDEVRTLSLIHI